MKKSKMGKSKMATKADVAKLKRDDVKHDAEMMKHHEKMMHHMGKGKAHMEMIIKIGKKPKGKK